jgi:hypothetical protein
MYPKKWRQYWRHNRNPVNGCILLVKNTVARTSESLIAWILLKERVFLLSQNKRRLLCMGLTYNAKRWTLLNYGRATVWVFARGAEFEPSMCKSAREEVHAVGIYFKYLENGSTCKKKCKAVYWASGHFGLVGVDGRWFDLCCGHNMCEFGLL